jgi:hypothetical protein
MNRQGRLPFGRLVLVCLTAVTIGVLPAVAQGDVHWTGGDTDPMYDFDQKQPPSDPWGADDCPGFRYTWCGPTALANALCWSADHVHTDIIPPELRTGGQIDPVAVIEALADLTDGGTPGCNGVSNLELQQIADDWIAANASAVIEVTSLPIGDFDAICNALRANQTVIALLGIWKKPFGQPFDPPQRQGGHFVTLAGGGTLSGGADSALAICDPYWDSYSVGETGGRGKGTNGDTRGDNDPTAHNDTANYSHDLFGVARNFPYLMLDGYISPENLGAPFGGQNPREGSYISPNLEGAVIEWAFAIGPPEPFGTTIITHGFTLTPAIYHTCPDLDTPSTWMYTMAEAIRARSPRPSDPCPSATGGTILVYDPCYGVWNTHCGSEDPNEEIILLFNWRLESDGVNFGGDYGYAEAAGDALYAALRDPILPGALSGHDLLASGIHFIGHSRGTAVNSECIRRLAAAGIGVDQVTTLDPHPVDGDPLPDWGDPQPTTWDNVEWADNYYRADINPADFDGQSCEGAYNDYLDELDEECGDSSGGKFEHSKTHSWYHGTIDLDASSDGAGQPICRSVWYSNNGSDEGFFYSDLGGGTANRPPVEGAASHSTYSTTEVYNGDFEILGSCDPGGGGEIIYEIGHAGWRYHGGSMDGPCTPWGSDGFMHYATLSPLTGLDSLLHNRLYIDESVAGIRFDRRAYTLGSNDLLKVILVTAGDSPAKYSLGSKVVTNTYGQWEECTFAIPLERRGQSYAIRFEAIDNGPTGLELDIDNIAFAFSLSCDCPSQGDLDADGYPTPLDLAALIDILWAGSPDLADPICPTSRSDLDCDGFATPLDFAFMVDWLFAAGEEPCDPCE